MLMLSDTNFHFIYSFTKAIKDTDTHYLFDSNSPRDEVLQVVITVMAGISHKNRGGEVSDFSKIHAAPC